MLVTADTCVEGAQFPREAPSELVGGYAAAVNLSDIAAKGGDPAGLMCALLLSDSTPAAWAKGVIDGMERTAKSYGIDVIGGDTKRSDVRAVCGIALGLGRSGKLMPRSAAKEGDLVAVTGEVGNGGGNYMSWKHNLCSKAGAMTRMLTISPRIAEGKALSEYANAAADTSDGLAKTLRLVAEASGLSVDIDMARIPFAGVASRAANSLEMETEEVAFIGGDYELVAAVPPRHKLKARQAVEAKGGKITFIGEFKRGKRSILRKSGRILPLPKLGWDSFSPLK